MSKTLIVILGPTCSGKTSLAIEVAQALHTEIISCDSRQFYRELNIGTAKPSIDELNAVHHHLINSLSIQDEYNAGNFEEEALRIISRIHEKADAAVMVGGSGLYIKAVCEGLDQLPKAQAELRAQLTRQWENEGLGVLQAMLKTKDPDNYETIDNQNPHRVIRALEVMISTGRSIKDFYSLEVKKRPFQIIKIGLELDRELLYTRINERVDSMMDAGLLEEARSHYNQKGLNALQTVGYQELFPHIAGEMGLGEAVELIKRNTRRYAKRQLTWFRKDVDIQWFPAQDHSAILARLNEQLVKNSTTQK